MNKENRLVVKPSQVFSPQTGGVEVEGGTITPAAIQTIVQLQMSTRLRRVYETLEAQIPQGISVPVGAITISGTVMYRLEVLKHGPSCWFSFNLINDGGDSVYVGVNQWTKLSEVKDGESMDFNAKTGTIEDIYLVCNDGESSTCRVFGMY